jgi:hypothetical protein
MVAQLSLAGKFVQIPEPLFYRRFEQAAATELMTTEELRHFYMPGRRSPLRFQVWRLQAGLWALLARAHLGLDGPLASRPATGHVHLLGQPKAGARHPRGASPRAPDPASAGPCKHFRFRPRCAGSCASAPTATTSRSAVARPCSPLRAARPDIESTSWSSPRKTSALQNRSELWMSCSARRCFGACASAAFGTATFPAQWSAIKEFMETVKQQSQPDLSPDPLPRRPAPGSPNAR